MSWKDFDVCVSGTAILFGILLPETDSCDNPKYHYEQNWYPNFVKKCRSLNLRCISECSVDRHEHNSRLFVGIVLHFTEYAHFDTIDLTRSKSVTQALSKLQPFFPKCLACQVINMTPKMFLITTSDNYGSVVTLEK